MKVWRIFTLLLWGIFLLGFTLISVTQLFITSSLLDQARTKQALEQGGFYKQLQSSEFINALEARAVSSTNLSDTGVLTRSDLRTALVKTFPEDKVKTITGNYLDVVYEWLDKKRPDLAYSVDISSEKQQLTQTLKEAVAANVQKLPECDGYGDISEDPTKITCLPFYVDAATVTVAIQNDIESQINQVESTVTNEDLGVTPEKLGVLRNAPDYLGYLWALTIITAPLAVLSALYLLIKRRGSGVIVIGIVALIVGSLAAVGYSIVSAAISNPTASQTGVESGEIILKELIKTSLIPFAAIGITAGVIFIILGVIWIRAGRKKKQSPDHYVAERLDD